MSSKKDQKKQAQEVQATAKGILVESHKKIAEALVEPDPATKTKLLSDAESLAKSAAELSSFAATMVE